MMKINEIIRRRRLAKHLTQEQVANYLGVTAPAVNKWEKGTSYPDITLLPSLARLLDTDLNTLLSFQDELTDEEISLFLEKIAIQAEAEGYDVAYTSALKKIQDYPTCYSLIFNVAAFLDGARLLDKSGIISDDQQATIEALYQRALASPDNSIRNQAHSMLISKYMMKKDYTKAQELIDQLSEENFVDRKRLQMNLNLVCNRVDEAAKIAEEKLLACTNELMELLLTMMEIALKEKRRKDAKALADISQKTAKLFDLWEYHSYAAQFQLYVTTQNREQCLAVLQPLLHSLTQKWPSNDSPLYRHLETKKLSDDFGDKLRNYLLRAIEEDKELQFLKESPDFKQVLKEYLN